MAVSHRNLLEWTTHQEAGLTGNPSLAETYLIMLPAPAIGVALLLGMALNHPASPAIALFALAWTLSPAIAWGISQPARPQTTSLTPVQELSLIHISEPTRQAEISYAVFCL